MQVSDAWVTGYEAFHAGITDVAMCNASDEWRSGWLYAHDEERIGYVLGRSLRDAGLTNAC